MSIELQKEKSRIIPRSMSLMDFIEYTTGKKDVYIILHQFTKGYMKRLESFIIKGGKWPFDISEGEWVKQYDGVFFMEGGETTIAGWTSDRGRYENMQESDRSQA